MKTIMYALVRNIKGKDVNVKKAEVFGLKVTEVDEWKMILDN